MQQLSAASNSFPLRTNSLCKCKNLTYRQEKQLPAIHSQHSVVLLVISEYKYSKHHTICLDVCHFLTLIASAVII